jgi:UDP-glucose 4-epimerase
VRNWTYVDDIVSGMILTAEKIDDGAAVNLGTMERVRVIDAVKMVLEYTGQKATIKFCPDMPTGPLNRVADNSLAKKLLGWEPQSQRRAASCGGLVLFPKIRVSARRPWTDADRTKCRSSMMKDELPFTG